MTVLVLHAASHTHKYNVCVHSVLNVIHQLLVYAVHAIHAAGLELSHTYFAYDKLKLSAAYHVIVLFAVNEPFVGVALTVGLVRSIFALFDWFVVLQFHAASHTLGVTLHVHGFHSHMRHVTGVHDAIHANASV